MFSPDNPSQNELERAHSFGMESAEYAAGEGYVNRPKTLCHPLCIPWNEC